MTKRVIVVAPGRNITQDIADRVLALAANTPVKVTFHPQCFLSHGHFAGKDAERAAAFIEAANDPAFNAVWLARGGYGAVRITDVVSKLGAAARQKTYLGYSDNGFLLAPLYKHQIGRQVHAPIPVDITRTDGEAAIMRVLDWLQDETQGVESQRNAKTPTIAMNATVLASLQGTDLLPDFTGHELLIEEVSEYDYRFDRALFQIMEGLKDSKLAGLRLGRVLDIPTNTIEFGQDAEAIAKYWCAKFGIPYLGRADIGHDIDNKIVPFGLVG